MLFQKSLKIYTNYSLPVTNFITIHKYLLQKRHLLAEIFMDGFFFIVLIMNFEILLNKQKNSCILTRHYKKDNTQTISLRKFRMF